MSDLEKKSQGFVIQFCYKLGKSSLETMEMMKKKKQKKKKKKKKKKKTQKKKKKKNTQLVGL